MHVTLNGTLESDFERLVQLRLRVMRESLDRIGRFDPGRARDRFRASFRPEDMSLIFVDGTWVGCVSLKRHHDHLEIEHFYLDLDAQGRGIGSVVMAMLLEEAGTAAVRLGVLKQSRAADFYRRHGFTFTHETEFDEYYELVRTPPDGRP